MELTPEQAGQILAEIEQREILERQALAQRQKVRQQESERQYREGLAIAARQAELERKERLTNDLNQSLKYLEEAIAAFQEGNENECYRQLVKYQPVVNLLIQRLNQAPQLPTNGSIPTVRVKAPNLAAGWAIINAEDFIEEVHQIYEEGTK